MPMILLVISNLYSQQIILNNETKDTSICFTIPQSKFLLKTYYKLNECDTLMAITQSELNNANKINDLNTKVIANDRLVFAEKDEMIADKNTTIDLMCEEHKKQQKRIFWQKVYKSIFFVSTIAISTIYVLHVL